MSQISTFQRELRVQSELLLEAELEVKIIVAEDFVLVLTSTLVNVKARHHQHQELAFTIELGVDGLCHFSQLTPKLMPILFNETFLNRDRLTIELTVELKLSLS